MRNLATNLERLCISHTELDSILEVGRRADIGKSTINRIKKGETAVRIDNLEKLARIFGLEAWQMLVPDLDPARPPAHTPLQLSETEAELLSMFTALGEPERNYIIEKARSLLSIRSNTGDAQ